VEEAPPPPASVGRAGFERLSSRLFVVPADTTAPAVVEELNGVYEMGTSEKTAMVLVASGWDDEGEFATAINKAFRVKGGKAGAKFWKGVREAVMKLCGMQDLLLLISGGTSAVDQVQALLKNVLDASDTKAAADSLVGLKSGKVLAVLWDGNPMRCECGHWWWKTRSPCQLRARSLGGGTTRTTSHITTQPTRGTMRRLVRCLLGSGSSKAGSIAQQASRAGPTALSRRVALRTTGAAGRTAATAWAALIAWADTASMIPTHLSHTESGTVAAHMATAATPLSSHTMVRVGTQVVLPNLFTCSREAAVPAPTQGPLALSNMPQCLERKVCAELAWWAPVDMACLVRRGASHPTPMDLMQARKRR